MKRGGIILIAIIFSIVLYLAGVFTGLNANKVIEQKFGVDIIELRNIMYTSTLDVKNIQLQQLFIDNFEEGDRCEFLDLYLNHLYTQASAYWEVLPARLEEYEKNYEPTDEYNSLKREYIRLSLRFWVIASSAYDECDDLDIIPILYFYSRECEHCVEQGEEFDNFNSKMKLINKTLIVFPIDGNFEDDTVFLLKKFYNITSYPATIINSLPIQGTVVDSENLRRMLRQ